MINPETGITSESSEAQFSISNNEQSLAETPESRAKMESAMSIARVLRSIEGQES